MEALAVGIVIGTFALVWVVCELLAVCKKLDEELEDVH